MSTVAQAYSNTERPGIQASLVKISRAEGRSGKDVLINAKEVKRTGAPTMSSARLNQIEEQAGLNRRQGPEGCPRWLWQRFRGTPRGGLSGSLGVPPTK